jgi:hypothetical protein
LRQMHDVEINITVLSCRGKRKGGNEKDEYGA